MVILKKIGAATLIETLIASVIIVTVFTIASLSLNNIFRGAVNQSNTLYKSRIEELVYFTKNKKIIPPFYEETNQWEITIDKKNNSIRLIGVFKPSKKNDTILIK